MEAKHETGVWAPNLTRLQLNLRPPQPSVLHWCESNRETHQAMKGYYYQTCQEAQSLNKRVMQCICLP